MQPYPGDNHPATVEPITPITVRRDTYRQPQATIPTLRGSTTLGLCAMIYQRHQPDQDGCCRRCLVPIGYCQPRRHAMKVIEAAGFEPSMLDDRL